MSAIEHDEMAQKVGVVFIWYEVLAKFTSQVHKMKKLLDNYSIFDSVPYRITSTHYCYSDTAFKNGFNMLFRFFPRHVRVRFNDHYGTSHMEAQYKLMSFGITPDMLPINHEGVVKGTFLQSFLTKLRLRAALTTTSADESKPTITTESFGMVGSSMVSPTATTRTVSTAPFLLTTSSSSQMMLSPPLPLSLHDDPDIVEVASDNDVLLGRGLPCQSHPGNVRLGQLIKDHQSEFNELKKTDKTKLTYKIVNIIQNDYGGRFLEKDPTHAGMWRICSTDVARNKVSYGFRSLVKLQRRKGLERAAAGGGSHHQSAVAVIGPTTTPSTTGESNLFLDQQVTRDSSSSCWGCLDVGGD